MNLPVSHQQMHSAVRGCWLGKNIGGTLGAPFEGSPDVRNISFYAQENLDGNPEPNDDLDLQLMWLTMAEYHGIDRLTSRLFGEYWINGVVMMANEYVVCQKNCKNGFYPPVSGAVNNDDWKWSNGAWIRSEIWACLFPGDPDKAIEYAWLDASCDHTSEGIYAEMFTAALESAAFAEKDLRKLIDIGLSKIPADSRMAKSVKFVCDCYDAGDDWRSARAKVVEFNSDLGFFQAPGNVAFVVIGLLYGEGDFGKSICTAVNCGDDTDCTGATVGAIMGIMYGAENIPDEWVKPIGDRILTKSFDAYALPLPCPKTITELTRRVIRLQKLIAENFPRETPQALTDNTIAKRLWARSSMELPFDLGYVKVGVEYLDSPLVEPGQTVRIRLHLHSPIIYLEEFYFRWKLENGWKSNRMEVALTGESYCSSSIDTDLIVPEDIGSGMSYVILAVNDERRKCPAFLSIPFQRKGFANYPVFRPSNREHTSRDRYLTICKMIAE